MGGMFETKAEGVVLQGGTAFRTDPLRAPCPAVVPVSGGLSGSSRTWHRVHLDGSHCKDLLQGGADLRMRSYALIVSMS